MIVVLVSQGTEEAFDEIVILRLADDLLESDGGMELHDQLREIGIFGIAGIAYLRRLVDLARRVGAARRPQNMSADLPDLMILLPARGCIDAAPPPNDRVQV